MSDVRAVRTVRTWTGSRMFFFFFVWLIITCVGAGPVAGLGPSPGPGDSTRPGPGAGLGPVPGPGDGTRPGPGAGPRPGDGTRPGPGAGPRPGAGTRYGAGVGTRPGPGVGTRDGDGTGARYGAGDGVGDGSKMHVRHRVLRSRSTSTSTSTSTSISKGQNHPQQLRGLRDSHNTDGLTSSKVSSPIEEQKQKLKRILARTLTEGVLHHRNVYTCGFGDYLHFATNFLQPLHLHRHKHLHYLPFANASDADVVVVFGLMEHCRYVISNFTGTVIYIDNEAGRPVVTSYLSNFTQTNVNNMIYLGVPTIDLPPVVIKIPCIYGVETLEWSDTTVKRVFSRNSNHVTRKTRFLAYAASKCLPMREHVFDALVNLSLSHNLGKITTYGACHGSPANINFSHTHLQSSNSSAAGNNSTDYASRRHFKNNGLLFRPYKYVLAMENADADHYMTEKIFYAYQAGAIPLYWGASSIVHDIFHPDTFIYINPNDLQPALDRILEIEKSPELYRKIMQTPPLLHGEETIKKYFAVGISAVDATDPQLSNSSISNRIWSAIFQRLQPISNSSHIEQ